MNDKQLLQMLEVLGKNSRIRSLAGVRGSEDNHSVFNDTKCAKTIRDIITSNYDLGKKYKQKSWKSFLHHLLAVELVLT